ncbi:MAG: hypothetical protein ACRCZO_05420, partial [Cetobacterium sp.]
PSPPKKYLINKFWIASVPFKKTHFKRRQAASSFGSSPYLSLLARFGAFTFSPCVIVVFYSYKNEVINTHENIL